MGTDSVSVINIVYLILLVISSSFLVLLTLLMLQSSAKPKLRVTVSSPGKDKLEFHEGELSTLRFYLENVGHWYWAKPAASNVRLRVNFEIAFNPRMIRYGSDLEISNGDVRPGVGNGQYMKAQGIYLFHEEAGEAVEVDVQMPTEEGTYSFWVAAHANEGGCGVHKFKLKVI
jgi:hypothetical protein